MHAWCLMPSHLHRIASRKGTFQLHEIFRDFKKFTADEILRRIREINERRKEWLLKLFAEEQRLTRITHYKVWQDGNHPVELVTHQMLDERLHYIHYNAVEAGMVWRPEDYCYSSAIDYAAEKGYLQIELIQ